MSGDVRELLYEYALGMLEQEDRERVDRAMLQDTALADEVRAIHEDLSVLSTELPPAPPAAPLRQRLLDAVRHHGRLEGFAEQMAGIIDATVERARHLLRLLDDESAWLPLFPNCDGLHIKPGPAVAGLDVGLIRMAPGSAFPEHKHLGIERVLVLQGRLRDDEGNEYQAGDLIEKHKGSSHSFVVIGDDELVYLVVAAAVEIPGFTFKEPPPEMLH